MTLGRFFSAWTSAVIAAHIALMPRANASSESANSPWFQGSVTAAFDAAKAGHKHMLLYWGAVWCPPCNELKSQVFTQPRFAELMRPMIAVALDGDSDEAQAWAEKLRVQGYPTVLLLSPEGQELMRLPTAVSMEEFESALIVALKNPRGIDLALQHGLEGKASVDEWSLLSNYSWHEDSTEANPDKLLQTLMTLIKNIPNNLSADKGRLVALFLTKASTSETQKDSPEIRQFAAKELASLYRDAAAATAARSIFAYSPGVEVWLYPNADLNVQAADKSWLTTAASVARAKESSADMRLWASVAPMLLYSARHPNDSVPKEFRDLVVREVARSDQEASSSYERKAVISGAATLLGDVGDFDGARKLLAKELKKSDTPWYLLASFAHLEKAAGHNAKALDLIAKARQSAKGRASKLQWIQADLAMTASIKNERQIRRLASLLGEFYDTASTLDDGFQGRNARTAVKVADSIRPFLNQNPIKNVVAKAAKRCLDQKKPAHCQDHFTGLGQMTN